KRACRNDQQQDKCFFHNRSVSHDSSRGGCRSVAPRQAWWVSVHLNIPGNGSSGNGHRRMQVSIWEKSEGMRPITVLNGIIMGSCGSIFIGIAVTLVIFLVLSPDNPSLQREMGPLSVYAGIFAGLTVLSVVSFMGHLRMKAWRWWAQLALLLAGAGAVYYLLP